MKAELSGLSDSSKETLLPYVSTSIDISASVAIVYTLAKDQERFPEFMPDVESVVILERTSSRALSRWKTLVEDAPIEWLEEDLFDDVTPQIRYRLLEGDLERFEGSWTFKPLGDSQTTVELSVDFDFGVPTLAELIGPLLESKVRENSRMMLEALKQQAETMQSLS